MPSDQQVSAKAVLDAVLALRRQGSRQAIEHLEQIEPDLTDYLLETLSDIHRQLLALGGPARQSRRLYRQVQSLVLVTVTALRNAHYELWRQSPAGEQFEQPDSDDPPTLPDTDS